MYETLLTTLLLLPNISKDIKKIVANMLLNIPDKESLYELLDDYFNYGSKESKQKIFLSAYDTALRIKKDAKKFSYEIMGKNSISLPSRLKKVIDPLTILHVKGNINSLEINSIACYGKDKYSEYIFRIGERIGSRIAENNVSLIVNLNQQADFPILAGSLHSHGHVIGLIDNSYNDNITNQNSYIEKILQSGGCIINMNPPYEVNTYSIATQIDNVKVGLSDAVIIIEMDDNIPIEEIYTQKKELYCISLEGNYRNYSNELLISSGRAQPIKNKDCIIYLSKKIASLYTEYKDCIIYCFKSISELDFFDKIIVQTNFKKEVEIFSQDKNLMYDISKLEIILDKENKITKVIDHIQKKKFLIRSECLVTAIKKESFSVLYDVECLITGCDIALRQDIDYMYVDIQTYNREEITSYCLTSNQLENEKVKIEFNNKNEFLHIYDKEMQTYFYPFRNKKIIRVEKDTTFYFREVYFNSDFHYIDKGIELSERPPIDYDCIGYYNLEDLIIKYYPYPYSDKVFRIMRKKDGTVYYINSSFNQELYEASLKDYEDYVLTNKLGQEDNNLKNCFNQTLKESIRDQLLNIVENGYKDDEIEEMKAFIYEELQSYLESVSIDKVIQEFIIEHKYEYISSMIDEIVDYKTHEMLEFNLKLIFNLLDEDSNDVLQQSWR